MCGIIGVFENRNNSQNYKDCPIAQELAMLGLFAEQHRGQESCGMAVSDGGVFKLKKEIGLAKQVFTPEVLATMKGNIAIGHVRYPTRGAVTRFNSQPHVVETLSGPSYALASNGDIVNYQQVRQELEREGIYFISHNDGELLAKFIVYYVEKKGFTITDAIKLLMKRVKGAYSTVFATGKELYVFRDPNAFRPLVWGKTQDGSFVASSESCALNILGIMDFNELEEGEIVCVNEEGITSINGCDISQRECKRPSHCVFEHIYFSRPDSYHFGENVFQVRERIGILLADLDEVKADMVIPVPDSANFIALEYAKRKNIPFEMGLIRNHYVGRTFIKPAQTVRDEDVQQKYNALPNFFKDKTIVLIDDSIVRGTTIKQIIKLLRKAGAKEIHLRVGSPQVKYSCYYGINTPTREELISNKKTLEEIREYIGADSLIHLPMEALRTAVSKPDNYCYACFTGEYPVTADDE